MPFTKSCSVYDVDLEKLPAESWLLADLILNFFQGISSKILEKQNRFIHKQPSKTCLELMCLILWNTTYAASSYLRFRCSNSTLRILQQAVKYIQSCKQKHQNINFEHTFHFEQICPYVFNIDFEHVNPAKNWSDLKVVLFMPTNTRGHILTRAGFVSKSLSENSGRH